LKLQIQPIQIRPLENSRLNFWPTIRLRRTNKNFVDAVCASNLPQGKGNQSIFIKMLFNLNATALRLDAVTSSSFVLRPSPWQHWQHIRQGGTQLSLLAEL